VGAAQGHDLDGVPHEERYSFHYALADTFTVCDAYHCSLLGPTDPNRYHMWTVGWAITGRPAARDRHQPVTCDNGFGSVVPAASNGRIRNRECSRQGVVERDIVPREYAIEVVPLCGTHCRSSSIHAACVPVQSCAFLQELRPRLLAFGWKGSKNPSGCWSPADETRSCRGRLTARGSRTRDAAQCPEVVVEGSVFCIMKTMCSRRRSSRCGDWPVCQRAAMLAGKAAEAAAVVKSLRSRDGRCSWEISSPDYGGRNRTGA